MQNEIARDPRQNAGRSGVVTSTPSLTPKKVACEPSVTSPAASTKSASSNPARFAAAAAEADAEQVHRFDVTAAPARIEGQTGADAFGAPPRQRRERDLLHVNELVRHHTRRRLVAARSLAPRHLDVRAAVNRPNLPHEARDLIAETPDRRLDAWRARVGCGLAGPHARPAKTAMPAVEAQHLVGHVAEEVERGPKATPVPCPGASFCRSTRPRDGTLP